MSSISEILELIKKKEIHYIDLRFTDTRGKEQHITVRTTQVDNNFFTAGKMFDGSSISGWKRINQSDMVLMPDLKTAIIDPFYEITTLNLRCDIIDPLTKQSYTRDPRSVAKRAEQFLTVTDIADTAYFGPEPEFFIFDDVRWQFSMNSASYSVDSFEAAWNSGNFIKDGNLGHRPRVKGGYFPVPPVDSSHGIRSTICLTLEKMQLIVEAHHHEVATGNQNEITTQYNSLVKKADELQILKYVVHNIAHAYGKSATFMPKPIVGDNGNGMHCHLSLFKDGINIFAGDQYSGLSEQALFCIGGILHHAKALNAFTNSTTNSYKRLVPGFEAPVTLAYSACNRSAAIRIPHVISQQAKRIEIRFPDAATNPYLAFSAIIMAGIDGIRNKIHPGKPMNEDLYNLSPKKAQALPTVCSSLDEAISHLDKDRAFLKQGCVFSDDLIDGYIMLKQKEVTQLSIATHPIEFELYYSL